jgi:TRAP-type C4-dicarboxylate transport system substrate-binding protein
MTKIRLFVAASAITLLSAGAAHAGGTINIVSWAPPSHSINAKVWPWWGNCIKKATGGSVTWKIEYHKGHPKLLFDRVRTGSADASWIFHGYSPGRFPLEQVVEMPGLGVNAEAASVAYWRVYQKYLAKAGEHKGTVLIGLTSHGQGVLHTRKPIRSWADVKGLKIRVPGGVGTQVIKLLGGTGVGVPAPQVYETLAQGVADGIIMPMETKKSFKLAEVAPYSLIVPGGMYYGAFAFIMNPAKLKSFTPAEQKAVMGCSGEPLSRVAGQAWDAADAAGLAFAKKSGNHIRTADDKMTAEFYNIVSPIETKWIAEANKKGVNGAAALADMRTIAKAEMDKINAKKAMMMKKEKMMKK